MKASSGGCQTSVLAVAIVLLMLPLAVVGADATQHGDGLTANWSSAGSMNVPRYHHTSTTLAGGTDCPANSERPAYCGKVLSVGGTSIHKTSISGVPHVKDPASVAELYDPAKQKWTTVPGPSIRRPAGHTATRMPNGQVMVIGGVELDGAYPRAGYAPAGLIPELYTPSDGSWTKAEPMNVARGWHTATLLRNGKVLVLGGLTPLPSPSGQSLVPTASAELYDPANGGSWTQLPVVPQGSPQPGSLGRARYSHVASVVQDSKGDEKVLVTGGRTNPCSPTCTTTASAELIDPFTGVSEQPFAQPPGNMPRWGHTASPLSDGQILVAGSQDSELFSADIYNPKTKTWCADVSPPRMQHFFSSSVLIRPNTVLLAGRGRVEYFTHEFGTCRGAWRTLDAPATPRHAHTANLLLDGKMLLAGGTANAHAGVETDAIGPAELLSLEAMPSLTIHDVEVKEGNAGSSVRASFKVSLLPPSNKSVSVGYYTQDSNAFSRPPPVGAPDYIEVPSSQPGILTFGPGETSKFVTVDVVSDNIAEPDENFLVKLVAPRNAKIADGVGNATILNDDNPPAVYATVEGPSTIGVQQSDRPTPVPEGNAGQATLARFTVKLSSAPPQKVTLTYATEDGTAQSSSGGAGGAAAAAGGGPFDYEARPKTVLTFPAGDHSKITQSIDVQINGDNSTEAPETFFLNLSSPTGAVVIARRQAMAVIENDDFSAPLVNISDSGVEVNRAPAGQDPRVGTEPDAGTAGLMKFTIYLSDTSGERVTATQDVTVKWSTADGIANSDGMEKDYEKVPPTSVTIPAGSSSVDVHVIVYGDTTPELDEVFFVGLSEPSGAILRKAQGYGLIANDDNPPRCIYSPVPFCI